MAMTRKHYQAFADMFKRIKPISERPTWDNIVIEAADMFAKDNPRFDRNKFYEACRYNG